MCRALPFLDRWVPDRLRFRSGVRDDSRGSSFSLRRTGRGEHPPQRMRGMPRVYGLRGAMSALSALRITATSMTS
jgi:hypothetical protein